MKAKPSITKQQFEHAKYTAAKLRPLADALAAVNDQALGCRPEAIAKFNDFCDYVTPMLLEAGRIIARAKEQYENRDKALINAAASRFLAIDGDIELAKTKQRSLRENYKIKFDELAKKQFSTEEIEKIVTDSSEEVQALNTAIESLKNEKTKIQAFLNDGPEFNENLLVSTGVFALRGIDGEAVGYDPAMLEHAAGLQATVAHINSPQAETEEAEPNHGAEMATSVGLRAMTLQMLIDAENRLGQFVVDEHDRKMADF